MTNDGRAVANFILDYCDSKGRTLTNVAMQKVIYFCHAWSLIKLNKPLVNQNFEAWQYGPVLQYLYHEFKEFDRSPITSRAHAMNMKTGRKEIASQEFDQQTTELLKEAVDFYSPMSPFYLVELSHVEGGPWDKVWNNGGKVNPGMQIDNKAIAEYYAAVERPQ